MSLLQDLLAKVKDADFIHDPFPHVYIRNFLPEQVFRRVTNDPFIRLDPASRLDDLHAMLSSMSWKIQRHPGCAFSFEEYADLRRNKINANSLRLCGDRAQRVLCEGAGLTYRLSSETVSFAQELVEIFNSTLMRSCLLEKFQINEDCTFDSGIQKYLDCYEISPHPDVREKALTFMLNINPFNSEAVDCHTHFLRFIPQYEYIYSFWERCPDYQRCWVPWDWCHTIFRQTENNSISIFRPSSSSLHAVKADYHDLNFQRTQLYGNIWFKEKKHFLESEFMDLDLHARSRDRPTEKSQDAEPSASSKLALRSLLKAGLAKLGG
jgi:hypothetical protein